MDSLRETLSADDSPLISEVQLDGAGGGSLWAVM